MATYRVDFVTAKFRGFVELKSFCKFIAKRKFLKNHKNCEVIKLVRI